MCHINTHSFFFSDVIKKYQKNVFSYQRNIILFILMMKHETNPCVFKWLSGWTICPLCSSSRAARQPIPSFFSPESCSFFFFPTLIGKAAVAMCQRSCLFFQVTSLVSRMLGGMKMEVAIKSVEGLPSGKHTKSYGKSPSWIGKSTINGSFSVAVLNYQRVMINHSVCVCFLMDFRNLRIHRTYDFWWTVIWWINHWISWYLIFRHPCGKDGR